MLIKVVLSTENVVQDLEENSKNNVNLDVGRESCMDKWRKVDSAGYCGLIKLHIT